MPGLWGLKLLETVFWRTCPIWRKGQGRGNGWCVGRRRRSRATPQSRAANALAYFQRATALGGFHSPTALDTGYVQMRLGQTKEAAATFKAVKGKGQPIDAEIAQFWLTYLKVGAR